MPDTEPIPVRLDLKWDSFRFAHYLTAALRNKNFLESQNNYPAELDPFPIAETLDKLRQSTIDDPQHPELSQIFVLESSELTAQPLPNHYKGTKGSIPVNISLQQQEEAIRLGLSVHLGRIELHTHPRDYMYYEDAYPKGDLRRSLASIVRNVRHHRNTGGFSISDLYPLVYGQELYIPFSFVIEPVHNWMVAMTRETQTIPDFLPNTPVKQIDFVKSWYERCNWQYQNHNELGEFATPKKGAMSYSQIINTVCRSHHLVIYQGKLNDVLHKVDTTN